MNSITPSDYASEEKIAHNHERVRGLRDRTADLLTEDLCLVSQVLRPVEVKAAPMPDNQSAFNF